MPFHASPCTLVSHRKETEYIRCSVAVILRERDTIWPGESAVTLKQKLAVIFGQPNCVLFLDSLQSVFRKRWGVEARMRCHIDIGCWICRLPWQCVCWLVGARIATGQECRDEDHCSRSSPRVHTLVSICRITHKLTSPRPRGIVKSEIASWPRVWFSDWFCGDPTFSDSILTIRRRTRT